MAISKVLIWVVITCLILNEVEASKVVQPYRTGYHFQPPKNWINDPNGPMYYNGIYHLFYQYNPEGAVWGNIIWAHSISKDLINWIPLDPAITRSESFDINGCWSGSTTILPGNKPVILYTGIDSQNREVQNIAYPKNLSDPSLIEWVKPAYNPIIEPINGINSSLLRDPTTAWYHDGHWRILVGNQRGTRGMALLYKSRDFIKWTKAQHPLYSVAKTGIWECPDFFPVSLEGTGGLETSVMGTHVKHVLKVSLKKTLFDYYMVGEYFPEKDRFVPDDTSADYSTWLRYDYGNFYASKTFFDEGKDRRILLAWANESETSAQDVAKGWAGIQTIPRSLWLDENGRQLVQWPIKELETLREHEVHLSDVPLVKGGLVEVQDTTVDQADVEAAFHIPSLENADTFDPSWVDAQALCGQKDASVGGGIGPFGLLTLASEKLEEYTAVFFRIYKAKDKHVVLMCSGGERSSLRPEVYKPSFGGFVDVNLDDGKLSLRSLIDHSVVESFGAGGKICITSRVYPSLAVATNAHLYVFNNGTETVTLTKLNAWTMNKPKMNQAKDRQYSLTAVYGVKGNMSYWS